MCVNRSQIAVGSNVIKSRVSQPSNYRLQKHTHTHLHTGYQHRMSMQFNHKCHTHTHTHTNPFSNLSIRSVDHLSFRVQAITTPPTHTYTHTHCCQVVFKSSELCALQSSKMNVRSFDESNTPMTSGSFYLPTKTLTGSCSTLFRHLKCTCLKCE